MGKDNRNRALQAWKDDKTVRGTTAMFLVCLGDLASDDYGQIYESNRKLAERIRRSARFVTRHRERLVEFGLISVIDRGGPGRTSRWQLFPDHYMRTGCPTTWGHRVPGYRVPRLVDPAPHCFLVRHDSILPLVISGR